LGPFKKEMHKKKLVKKIDYDVQIERCQRNAERFYADARLLYKAKSYGHGVALCILGMEEIGKKIVLSSVRAGRLPENTGLQLVRNHAWKLFELELSLFMARDFDVIFQRLGVEPLTLPEKTLRLLVSRGYNRLKQAALYVEPIKGTSPLDPDFRRIAKTAINALPVYLNLQLSREKTVVVPDRAGKVVEPVLQWLIKTGRLNAKPFRSPK
jgi:AbiV family abortive infection protein